MDVEVDAVDAQELVASGFGATTSTSTAVHVTVAVHEISEHW